MDAEKAALIYGVQANLFTEYITTDQHAEMMTYPRLLALAEVAWSTPDVMDYSDFHRRALLAVQKLESEGYNTFNLKNEIGNRPGFDKPVQHLAVGAKVSYSDDAMYYPSYTAGGDTALVDGITGGWTYGDRRWQGFCNREGLDVTIDLGKVMELGYIGADFLQVCGPGVFLPAEVIISVSSDRNEFIEIKHLKHDVTQDDKVSFMNFGWDGKTSARYIRYNAKPGKFGGFLFTDEIIVR